MGPCVRLIRALVAQPELTDGDRNEFWEEYKNTVKTVGWTFIEKRITEGNRGRQSLAGVGAGRLHQVRGPVGGGRSRTGTSNATG